MLWAELFLILALLLANGVFAMSEMAIVSARKVRLRQRAETGDPNARKALELAEHPSRFLSTVQVGITLIGILAGAYGGATVAEQLAVYVERVPALVEYADEIAFAAVVAGVTFLSLVIGELVPKRIALLHPEAIARVVARPMHLLSVVATPIVNVLTASTDAILLVLGVRKTQQPPVTEEDISALIEEGTAAGVFEEEEQDLVEGIFSLGDLKVSSIMTPRMKMDWLDLEDPPEVNRDKMIKHRHSYFPVCEGGIDDLVGIVNVKDLWARMLESSDMDIRAEVREPLVVPATLRALRLLEKLRETGLRVAIVVDEHGGVEGIVTLNDVLEEITGDLRKTPAAPIVRREDGSWLVEATVKVEDFFEAVELDPRTTPRGDYTTLGGMLTNELGHIPTEGERVSLWGLRFEVVDMDGWRVDKVLVSPAPSPREPGWPPRSPQR
jgi:putative hemolysin